MTKDELAQFIGNSELSNDDKNMWQVVLASLDGQNLDFIAEFVADRPENLDLITQNIIKKKAALEAKDKDKIESILNEERDFIIKE